MTCQISDRGGGVGCGAQGIIFYSMRPDGLGDEFSLHASCPVGEGGGIKWAANKWVHNTPFNGM